MKRCRKFLNTLIARYIWIHAAYFKLRASNFDGYTWPRYIWTVRVETYLNIMQLFVYYKKMRLINSSKKSRSPIRSCLDIRRICWGQVAWVFFPRYLTLLSWYKFFIMQTRMRGLRMQPILSYAHPILMAIHDLVTYEPSGWILV